MKENQQNKRVKGKNSEQKEMNEGKRTLQNRTGFFFLPINDKKCKLKSNVLKK